MREIFDRHGRHDTKIIASGDLNEYKVEELVARGAPIDSFGVGTDLVTSRDVPALSVVYKLVETETGGMVEPKTKFSEEKVYWPGRKQIFRFSEDGQYHHDLLACAQEEYPEAAPLLRARHARRPPPGSVPASNANPRTHTEPILISCQKPDRVYAEVPAIPSRKALHSISYWRRSAPALRCGEIISSKGGI